MWDKNRRAQFAAKKGFHMIRFILVVMFVVLFLILSTPLMLVYWLIGKKNPQLTNRLSKRLIGWAFDTVARISGCKVIVLGQENIPTDTAVLYVGNHRSFFDIVLTLSKFPGITGYVAKKEMDKVPLLNIWMRFIHCLFLDRENIKEGMKTILAGIEKVKSGISLCIFPEGTRNKVNNTLLPFHDGSFKIADKGGVPVVPMTIVNSGAVFEDHLPRIKPTTVVIDFGKPLHLNELDKETRKNIGSYTADLILNRYFELKEKYISD